MVLSAKVNVVPRAMMPSENVKVIFAGICLMTEPVLGLVEIMFEWAGSPPRKTPTATMAAIGL